MLLKCHPYQYSQVIIFIEGNQSSGYHDDLMKLSHSTRSRQDFRDTVKALMNKLHTLLHYFDANEAMRLCDLLYYCIIYGSIGMVAFATKYMPEFKKLQESLSKDMRNEKLLSILPDSEEIIRKRMVKVYGTANFNSK